jgi:mRNA interferase MazF
MSKVFVPEAGDVVWLNLEGKKGHEQIGRRPALVLTAKSTHLKTGMAMVCPITSKSKGYSFELPYQGQKISGALLVLQVTSVDLAARQCAFIENADRSDLARVRRSVGLLIGLI